ncbi:MAG: hypothetical protein IT305_26610 [Chloroflexi bacterium]|nr:hypothetical protein [Chloroflexota bacterium]
MGEPTRRKLLGGGAALLAGALGAGVYGRRLTHADPMPADAMAPGSTRPTVTTLDLRLYGRNWQVQSDAPRAAWARPSRGQRSLTFGELLDGAAEAGAKVGEFYATCTCVNAPFGAGPLAATYLEQHTLNLEDGTLTGMGTSQGEESTFAIVGGTGRYAGARGSYVARQSPTGRGGDGTAELVVSVILDGTT